MVEQFDDPYEVRIGIPTVSWKYARLKDGITGIILPQEDGKAYRLSQQTTIQGDLLWWVQPDGSRKPRVQQDFLLGFVTDIKSGQPIADDEWMSGKAVARYADVKKSGDPDALALIALVEKFKVRRQIIKGESLEKGMKEAVRGQSETLGPKPVVAAIVQLSLTELKPNEHQGETKIYQVTYLPPTDESRAKVQEFLAARPQKSDPYQASDTSTKATETRGSAPDDDEEPPF